MKDRELAIDVGTSSVRAILFDSEGRSVDGLRAQRETDLRTDIYGAAELDAEAIVEEVAHCIDEVLQSAGAEAVRIAAVGVSTFWHSMVGVNEAGRAITPLYTWADTRSEEAAAELRARLDPEAVHARTGCAIHSSYFPARLLWLSRAQPDLLRRVRHWISPGEYLFQRLFGEARCSVSMASGTGLFDQNAVRWDHELLDALPVSEPNLSPLTDIDAPATGLRPEWASRWPALAQIPWAPAIGDGAASNLGSGCADDRHIAINLGTSGAIRVLWKTERVDIPPELWCYRLDRERPILGGAFSDGGSDYAWVRRTFQLPAGEAAERELAQRPPDGHGLTFLPFLAGERSVGWRPEARGTLHGLALTTTPLDALQAVMEGIALRFALVAERLFQAFPAADHIVASGGALGHAPIWAQMLADTLGKPILLSDETEASSRGAAIVALHACGRLVQVSDAPAPTGRPVEPNPAHYDVYRRALARQQDLYHRLR